MPFFGKSLHISLSVKDKNKDNIRPFLEIDDKLIHIDTNFLYNYKKVSILSLNLSLNCKKLVSDWLEFAV